MLLKRFDTAGPGPDEDSAWLALAAGIIRQALQDLRDARPCGPDCLSEGHRCAADARRYLQSPEAAALIVELGLCPDHLARLIENPDRIPRVRPGPRPGPRQPAAVAA